MLLYLVHDNISVTAVVQGCVMKAYDENAFFHYKVESENSENNKVLAERVITAGRRPVTGTVAPLVLLLLQC